MIEALFLIYDYALYVTLSNILVMWYKYKFISSSKIKFYQLNIYILGIMHGRRRSDTWKLGLVEN